MVSFLKRVRRPSEDLRERERERDRIKARDLYMSYKKRVRERERERERERDTERERDGGFEALTTQHCDIKGKMNKELRFYFYYSGGV